MKPGIVKLTAQIREKGAKASQELRGSFSVPAVLYGPTVQENILLAVGEVAVEKILNNPQLQFVELQAGDKTYLSVIKNVDFHPITDRPLHIDFILLDDAHEVGVIVPVKLKGTSKGVTIGGRLYQSVRQMRIKGLPNDLPSIVEIDITEMEIGNTVKVKDLDLGNVTSLEPKSTTIVVVNPPKGGAKNIKSDK